jgi:hypothetical protein
MYELLYEALVDTVKIFPLLLLIYFGIELIEAKFRSNIREIVEKAGRTGPILGALTGSIPQCGFSAIAAALYSQKLVTIGTLVAVFIATSDEAIPVILSDPKKAELIIPLIGIKIIMAMVFGYILDILFSQTNKATLRHIEVFKTGNDTHDHSILSQGKACCGHTIDDSVSSYSIQSIFIHSLLHSVTICLYIFATSFFLSFLLSQVDQSSFNQLFWKNPIVQPFIVALVGLIPNCAASVIIAEAYLNGVISYGSMVGGLCAGGGLGILVLMREVKNKQTVALIIGLLLGISVFVGIVLNQILHY